MKELKRGRKPKEGVHLDKYALYNACLANETNIYNVSEALGHARTWLYELIKRGGVISMAEYIQLKGMLRVNDNSLVKAVPIQRSEEVESIYSPYPVKKVEEEVEPAATGATLTSVGLSLTEENVEFVNIIARISGSDETTIVNNLINNFRDSAVAQTILKAVEFAKELAV